MKVEPGKVFSNGTEYENFMYCFCYRCEKGLLEQNGFPEYVENGGCPIWDAMENARFDESLFPSEQCVRLVRDDGSIKYWNVCTAFECRSKKLMASYKRLFTED